MVLFVVHGERNSGTNFLLDILSINGFPCSFNRNEVESNPFWKHGDPNKYAWVKTLKTTVVNIFIFRKLEDWLVSMYKNPYHLKKYTDFGVFLTDKQQANGLNDKNCDLGQVGHEQTIFEMRYYKFLSTIDYAKKNKNVFLVNMGFLQNEKNMLRFLNILNDTYMSNSLPGPFILSIPHTKSGESNVLNRSYDVDINMFKELIDQLKNKSIEAYINSLCFLQI
jgi:hypothetical protein